MKRKILPAILCAIAALCLISTARATVLVYEGFHEGDWTGIMASVDLASNPRKIGSKIDIGCYEARSSSLVLIIR